MKWILIVAGAVVVAMTLVDVAWTTVAAGSGAGPVTGRFVRPLWRLALAGHRRSRGHTLLSVAGVVIVFAVLLLWIALLLAGWWLVFMGSRGAVRDAVTHVPADATSRLYFVGNALFTLGNGGYAPGGGAWQMATVCATGTGLVLITLSITYLVPVASAVATRRQMAAAISSLGSTPDEIVTTAWTGSGFDGLALQLRSVATLLETSRQQHYTYPVLHFFHSGDAPNAAAPNITNLSQALFLLRFHVDGAVRPPPALLVPLDRTIESFLATLRSAHLRPGEPVPLPSPEGIAAAGIPVAESTDPEAAATRQERQRLLGALLRDDGW